MAHFYSTIPSGLQLLHIENDICSGIIALQGAHVLSWKIDQGTEMIWVSEASEYEDGKAIRGGIPICWPWFGPKVNESSHGFARTNGWTVDEVKEESNQTTVSMSLPKETLLKHLGYEQLSLSVTITFGKSLTVSLCTKNNGNEAALLSEALHTYFKIPDIEHLRINGLADTEYTDKLNNFTKNIQLGEIIIDKATDRVYHSNNDITIHNTQTKEIISITSQGGSETVVWNPWYKQPSKMTDMTPSGYRTMVCIEAANVTPILIAPGEKHVLTQKIDV